MRLKTALATPSFMDGVSQYSSLIDIGGERAYFNCVCGGAFDLSLTYDIYDQDQLQCSSCKRGIAPDAGERYVFKRVKSDAVRGGREFDLPFEWFKHAIHAPCHYCGSSDRNTINVASKRPGQWIVKNFRYNGLDRLNNDMGYVIQNCVPCCNICNRAKNSMVYQEFIEWINNMIYYRSN